MPHLWVQLTRARGDEGAVAVRDERGAAEPCPRQHPCKSVRQRVDGLRGPRQPQRHMRGLGQHNGVVRRRVCQHAHEAQVRHLRGKKT